VNAVPIPAGAAAANGQYPMVIFYRAELDVVFLVVHQFVEKLIRLRRLGRDRWLSCYKESSTERVRAASQFRLLAWMSVREQLPESVDRDRRSNFDPLGETNHVPVG